MKKFLTTSIIFMLAVMLTFQSMSVVYAGEPQIKLTSDNTLKVRFATEPATPEPSSDANMKIDFLKKESEEIQEHIDYTLSVTKNNEDLFNVKLTHTSTGAVTIPYQFPENGKYTVTVNVSGILFQPIPEESVSFPVNIGEESSSSSEKQTKIPQWIKSNAGWWAEGQIGDSDFVQGIQWLIKNGIMTVPPTESGEGTSQEIPQWIKSNAGWWAEGQIGDSDFVQGIQWLIKNGIMKI